MIRLRLFCTIVTLAGAACCAALASAAPSLNVTSSYNATADVIEWRISVDQDGSGFLAIEAPLTLAAVTPGFDVNLRANSSASQTTHSVGDNNGAVNESWYYNVDTNGTTLVWNAVGNAADLSQNLGNNPFAGTVTEGLWLDTANRQMFAALGSDTNMPQPVKTLHIASNDGTLNWANLIIGEAGSNVTLAGFRSSVVKGNMNGTGAGDGVDFLDLVGFSQIMSGNLAAYQAANPGLDGIARADMNNMNGANFGDLAAFGNCLQNGICPPIHSGGSGAGGGNRASAVPEPATAVLLALVALAAIGCARRKR